MDLDAILNLETPLPFELKDSFRNVAEKMVQAKKNESSIILMIGGHVIRAGVQNYIIDLMTRGYIDCLAMNGSGIIHDFELALIGATTESVARYIQTGEFGLWRETGYLNDIINNAFQDDRRYYSAFEETLHDRPWEKCHCAICKEIGIEVILLRGNNRNRRRGFHNTYNFYRQFKKVLKIK